jgi:hypothetical protein
MACSPIGMRLPLLCDLTPGMTMPAQTSNLPAGIGSVASF